jgi:hypothetical protein
MIVQEAARGAHSEVYEQQSRSREFSPHMLSWNLSRKTLAEILQGQHHKSECFAWLYSQAQQAEFERRLQIAPLGWTLDPSAFSQLHSDGLSIRELPTVGTCERMLPEYGNHRCQMIHDSIHPYLLSVGQY